MQPIRDRGRGKGRVDRQGRGRDGGRDRGQDGEGGRGTPEPTLPPLSPTPIFAPDTSIRFHTYPSPDTFIHPHTYTSPSIAPHTYTLVKTSTPHVIPALSPTSPPLQTTSLSDVTRASFHGSRYHLIISNFTIPYIDSH